MNLKEIVVDQIKERREEGAGTEDERDKAGGRVKRVGGKAVYACKSSVLTRCLLFFASPERVGVLRAPLYFIAKGNYVCRYVYTNIHTYALIYMYMYICICICVCVYVYTNQENVVARIHIHAPGVSLFHPLLYPWIPFGGSTGGACTFRRYGRFIENSCICVMRIPINNGSDIRWPISFPSPTSNLFNRR